MNKHFVHGVLAAVVSSAMGVTYLFIYERMSLISFSQVINIGTITGASVAGCTLMAIAYFGLEKSNIRSLKGWINLVIIALSFFSIFVPLLHNLPLDIDSPELFPCLAVPMHFFPAISFLALDSLFVNQPTLPIQ